MTGGVLYLAPALVNKAWRPEAPDARTLALSVIITAWAIIGDLMSTPADKRELPQVRARRAKTAFLLALAVGMGSDRVVTLVEGLLPGALG